MISPEFSILVANFNNGVYFSDCYNSLINQAFQNWECIIVDDHSTDDSIDLINNLIENDSRFKLYKNKENLGYHKSILEAVKYVKSPYFARLDPDDAIKPDAISSCLDEFKTYPNLGMVYSNYIICDENLNFLSIHKCKQVDSIYSEDFFNFKGEISHFCSFNTSIFKKINFESFQKRAVDKDIYMRMCELSEVKYIDKDLYIYRIQPNGISRYNNEDKAYFWHWVALIKMANRREINLEDNFYEKFVRKKKFDFLHNDYEKLCKINTLLKQSKWLKLGHKLGLFKGYKYL